MAEYYVYIMASKKNGTLYVGVTNHLARRVSEHKSGGIKGFTQKYGVHSLVYYETYGDVTAAIAREKHIKAWKRAWKLQLIEKENASWRDISEDLSV